MFEKSILSEMDKWENIIFTHGRVTEVQAIDKDREVQGSGGLNQQSNAKHDLT